MNPVNILRRNYPLFIGSLMLLVLLFMTFFGEYLPFIDRNLSETKYTWNEKHIPVAPPYAPSKDYIFGSDELGRDLLSLLVIGAKNTLIIIVLITLIRYLLAIPFAYFAHKRIFGAEFFLNWINAFLGFIPSIVIVVLIATLPPILTNDMRPLIIIFVLAALEVGRAADMIKQEFDEIASKEFVQGGLAIGVSSFRMVKSYYMPFLYDKLIINMITDLGRSMFLIGQLGFISIFLSQDLVQVDPGIFKFINNSITWPSFFANAFRDIRGYIWIPFFPSLAITYTILTFNVFAKGLQNLTKQNVSYF